MDPKTTEESSLLLSIEAEDDLILLLNFGFSLQIAS